MPKSPEQRRRRNQSAYAWVEVTNRPFTGGPSLPRRPQGAWPARTRSWWASISSMPHCALWQPADWSFAFDTALLHAWFDEGNHKLAAEIRLRERALGTTRDARDSMRLRYVDPTPDEEDATVSSIGSARARRDALLSEEYGDL